jgi:hypothetical protein
MKINWNKNSTLTMRTTTNNLSARWTWLIMAMLFILTGTVTKAQLVYNETFDTPTNTLTLPLGWSQGKFGAGTDPDNYWDRVTTSPFPTAFPRNGSGMARYLSYWINNGESSFLASKSLDMRAGIPVAGAALSFWMYRDNAGFTGNLDRIQVYANLTPDMNGSPVLLVEQGTGSTPNAIHRSCTQTPAPVTCNGWNQYSYLIPQAGFSGQANVYVVILGISAFGNNIYIDDFSVTSYPAAQTFTVGSGAVIFQNTSTTAPNQLNQMIIGCKINMSGAASPRTLTEMVFNTNGTSNPFNDIQNAKLWFSGGTNTFSTENAIQLGTYASPYATNDTFLISVAGSGYSGPANFTGLEHGDNFFWLTYDIKPGAIAGNFVDAEWVNFRVSGYAQQTPNPQTLVGARQIDVVYCVPSYTVGTSWLNYQTNDYIRSVQLVGDNIPPPGINNNQNWILTPAGSSCPTAPSSCFFQSHPPDYELFAEVAGKTTSVTANNTTVYPISLQVGTYGSGNVIAAWIDYNKDGVFNNWFSEVSVNATGAAGANTITLTGVQTHPGWRVGMTAAGTGIAPGATITAVAGVTVTLSANNIGAVSGAILFTTNDGEKIAQSQGMGSLGTYNTTFRVPTWATAGKTRMRVREVWINYNINPCQTYTYGETEDYRITIIPDCPTYPGYTTWLGLTSNWADPSNWCPSVAPINGNPVVNVRLPGAATPPGAYTYVRPVIVAGVNAVANKLRIEANDTLYINATTSSYLTVNDSMKIWTPTSALKINTTFIDTAQVFNGTLNRPADSPLNRALRTRSFKAYPQADLLLQGLQTNDIITNILVHIQRKANGQPYKNLTVKMYMTTNASATFGTGFAANIPTPISPVITVFSGDVNSSSFVPVSGDFGTIDIALTTPYQWDGSANVLIVEWCYDNTGFSDTGINDEVRFTQTTTLRRYMCLTALSDFPKAGCALSPKDTVMVSTSGTAGSNTVTINAGQVGKVRVGQIAVGPGPTIPGYQVIAVAGTTVTLSGNAITTFSNTNVTYYDVNNTSITFRPNLTFKYTRPYIKYPLTVRGHWENNGLFVPAVSRTFLTGSALQRILGSSVTTWYDLDISNNAHVSLDQDIVVTDSLRLVNGRLKLNLRLATLTREDASALTRTNGFIQADMDAVAANVAPFGRLRWNMGATLGNRVIPFVNAAGSYIPFDYNPQAGTNDVTFATYQTQVNNTNIPAPTVTNVFGFNGTAWNSDGSALVDRYWSITNAGVSPRAHLTYRWANSERAATNPTGAALMSAQRWLNSSSLWEFPYQPSQTYTPGTPDQLVLNNYTDFNNHWWVIVGSSTPLPVSLLDFEAIPYKDKVKLKWTTASEFNNSHFVVDRTVDQSDFTFIGRVESKGPSNNRQDYETWDMNPVEGMQYYFLRQHDVDGRTESYGPVSARFTRNQFDIVTATVSSSEMGLTVVFSYDSNEPYSYRIVDMLGKVIVAKDRNPAEPGINVIDIDAKLSKGAYQIMLQNNEKVVSRKFFY